MGDLDFSVNADTSNAQRNLDRLQKAVVNVNDTFIKFRNTIATISLGSFLQQTITSAARLDALSRSTGIAADTLKGFSDAVRAGGGNADQAADAISDLVKNIGDAANQGGELVKAFAKAGVSIQELRTSSEEDILRKTIDGIAKIGDNATESAVKAKIFGEALKTVNLNTVNGNLGQFIANARGFSAEAKAAADAQRQFATAVDKLQTVVLKISKPLLDLVNYIDLTSAAVNRFFAILGEALKFAAFAAGALLIGKALVFLGSAAIIAIAGIRTLGTGIAGLFKVLTTPLLRADLFKNLAMLSPGMATRIKAVSEAIGIPVAWLTAHWGKLTIAVSAAIGALKEYFGMSKTPEVPALATPTNTPPETDRGLEAANRLKNELAKQAGAYSLINAEHTRYTDKLRTSLGFQAGIVGLTEDQIELETKLREEADRYQDVVQGIVNKQKELKTSLIGEQDSDKAALVNAEVAKLSGTLKIVSDQHLKNRDIIERQTTALQQARKAEENRLFVREQIVKSLQAEITQQQALGDTIRGINQRMIDVKFGISLTGLSPLEKQIATINEEARKMATEAGNAFAATFEDKGFLTPEEALALSNGLTQIAEKYKDIAAAQIDNLNASRTWGAGWKDAFNEYVDNATNAAMIATDLFRSMTKNVEDSLVDMAKTGKFQWKNMLASMAEDLLRSQIRQLLSSLLGGKSATGGGSVIMGTIGSILGFRANGGPVMAGSPYIVGERGPELMIPNTNGTVVPNNALGGGTVIYNINAVDALSFKQMVARDPSFIHAVATQGGKSIPGTRR